MPNFIVSENSPNEIRGHIDTLICDIFYRFEMISHHKTCIIHSLRSGRTHFILISFHWYTMCKISFQQQYNDTNFHVNYMIAYRPHWRKCVAGSLFLFLFLYSISTHMQLLIPYTYTCISVCSVYTHVCIDISSITEQHYALLCSAVLIVLIRVCVCINVHKWYRWSTLECTASDKRNQPHTLNETATITTTQSTVWSKHERVDRQRKQKSEQCKAYANVREFKAYTTHWTKFQRPGRQMGGQLGSETDTLR